MAINHRLIAGTALALVVTVVASRALSQGLDSDFEALAACDKLDAIAGTGKSVSDYIVGSGFEQFAAAVVADCPKHLVGLGQAWEAMAADPSFDMFARLSPCAQLNSIESDGKSVSEFIVESGYDAFTQPVLANCPRHLESLGIAWQRLNPSDEPQGEGPRAFADLSPCEQLDVIDGTPGKAVTDHIFLSGIEDYAFAVRNQCRRHIEALAAAEQRSRTSSSTMDADFESLAPCQKLDVIDGTGKSVPEYIATSGVDEFTADVYAMCRRHIGNLIEAQRMVENGN
ncbi:MAG: hypothetical protein ACFBSG_12160 [Leptolyngbyaceae cyanobacterium]